MAAYPGAQWVFGYGSLIWKQDFPYLDDRPGQIAGWSRRFWQGSHDHRGVPDDPGRVVTLVRSAGAVCVGRAFLVAPEVFEHLDYREKNGYVRDEVEIAIEDTRVAGVVYHAPEGNPAFLGPAPVQVMAAQINRCRGPSGSNRDYLLQLARALRSMDVDEPHVFELERNVLALSR
jgi:glutathione-specific gamma-glutamylcyclotransferase